MFGAPNIERYLASYTFVLYYYYTWLALTCVSEAISQRIALLVE